MSKLKALRPNRVARKAFSLLPKSARHSRFRNSLQLDLAPPEQLVCELARTKEDLSAAFRILHDAYVDAGFAQPHSSGMRITRYHALPSTSTLVAKWDGEVVGTISIVRDSAFGFPLDQIFDVSSLRQKGRRVAEISSLAIKKEFRRERGKILFPLMKFMHNYCSYYFGTDTMVIAVNPRHIEFYEALFFFQRLQMKTVDSYDFANGAPAVGAFKHFRDMFRETAGHYGAFPAHKNLFSYFHEVELPNLKFPQREYFKVSDPIMSPDLLNYFFREQSSVFDDMNDHERAIIRGLYNHESYEGVLPAAASRLPILNRSYIRFDVKCRGKLVLGGGKRTVTFMMVEASLGGFKAFLSEGIRFGELLDVKVAIGEFEMADLKAWPVWSDLEHMYGFQIEDASETWRDFVGSLEAELHQLPAMVSSS